jgi:hypothetical protein
VAAGDRDAAVDSTFVELVARLAVDEPEVALTLVTGETLAGSLVAVGVDVLTLRVAPGPTGLLYCSAPSIASVRFRSG